ncbi:myosin-2 heavy chain-like [Aedes aegypti]|uniref:Uncharacterized protein n=1 Tax=Aedes aegypti TaxID=7159 RepID=A0A903VCR5_AEDAE|nr:myosin-2 heavy chain-like [Aedes aegypti]
MSILDESVRDIDRMKKGIENLKIEVAVKTPEGTTASLDDIKLEREALRGELRVERISIDAMQNKIDEETERIETICIKAKAKEGKPCKPNKAQAELEELKRMDAEIVRLCKELDALSRLNLAEEIQKIKRKLQESNEEMKKIIAAIDEKTYQIDSLKKEVMNQDMIERDYLDNRDLMKLKDETTSLKQGLDALMQSIGDMDAPNVAQERNKLLEQRDAIQSTKSQTTGQIARIGESEQSFEKELDRSEFKNAVKNYLKTYSESVVLKKMISDILTNTAMPSSGRS